MNEINRLASIAKKLATAADDATAITQLVGSDAITLDDAYEVQRQVVANRLDQGAKRIGMKMGFTS